MEKIRHQNYISNRQIQQQQNRKSMNQTQFQKYLDFQKEQGICDPEPKPEPGQISFKLLFNQQNKTTFVELLQLKSIISRKLPKMGKQYIMKTLFDGKHQSLAVLSGKQVIGGVTFKQNKHHSFIQIVFLAIKTTKQCSGFGSKLIAQLKNIAQMNKICYLITYADKTAIRFFRKQGFIKSNQSSRPSKWNRMINTYSGGEVMESKINLNFNYSNCKEIILKQKEIIINVEKQFNLKKSIFKTEYLSGIKENYCRKNSKGKQQYFNIDPLRIHGILQSGWSWVDHELKQGILSVQTLVKLIKLFQIFQNNSHFVNLCQSVEHISYQNKRFIDFKSIYQKLISCQYSNMEQVIMQILRMFDNMRQECNPKNKYYIEIKDIQLQMYKQLKELKQSIQKEQQK